jgi:hypothetical protein
MHEQHEQHDRPEETGQSEKLAAEIQSMKEVLDVWVLRITLRVDHALGEHAATPADGCPSCPAV